MAKGDKVTWAASVDVENKIAVFKVMAINGIDMINGAESRLPFELVVQTAAHILLLPKPKESKVVQ